MLSVLWPVSLIATDRGTLARLRFRTDLCAFNSVLTAACVLAELEVGIGCMGIIEHAFAGISAAVEPRWSDRARRYDIEQGLELGAYIFDRLCRDLHDKGKAIPGARGTR